MNFYRFKKCRCLTGISYGESSPLLRTSWYRKSLIFAGNKWKDFQRFILLVQFIPIVSWHHMFAIVREDQQLYSLSAVKQRNTVNLHLFSPHHTTNLPKTWLSTIRTSKASSFSLQISLHLCGCFIYTFISADSLFTCDFLCWSRIPLILCELKINSTFFARS